MAISTSLFNPESYDGSGQQLRDEVRRVRAENVELRADIITLLEVIDCANPKAWANGVTPPDRDGPDEGEILMSRLVSPLFEKYHGPVKEGEL